MAGPVGNSPYPISIEPQTASPSPSEPPLTRQPPPMAPLSAGFEPPRGAGAGVWHAKLTVQSELEGLVGPAAEMAIKTLLKNRFELDSCSPLPAMPSGHAGADLAGGVLYRYKASPSEPGALRCEAFYTTVPGVLLAALPVHPQMERRARLADPHRLPEPSAAGVATHLADPPIGLLTGVWQNKAGDTFHLHNNVMHEMIGHGGWAPCPVPGTTASTASTASTAHAAQLRMLGRQADGEVYAQLGARLFKLAANGAAQSPAPVSPAPQGALVRIDEHGLPVLLRDGRLTDAGVARPLALSRENAAGDWEPSPAEATDFAIAGGRQFVVLDHKGRLYDADGSAPVGAPPPPDGADPRPTPIDAKRIELPLPGGSRDWLVTALGQAGEGTIHAIAQHRDGQRVTLQRHRGGAAFEPAFMLDHAALLVRRQGLHVPADDDVKGRVALDGHAELGTHAGMAFFRESPRHPWAALNGADGQPLHNVDSVIASPFGFIDRKPVFALLSGRTTIVDLNLQGRTLFLPAEGGSASTPAGGPLMVVPAQVCAQPARLAAHDRAIGDFACDKARQVFFLEQEPSHKILTSQPGPPGTAAGLRDLNADRALFPLSLTVTLDNRPHVLHKADGGVGAIKRLEPDGRWRDVPLDLSGLAPGADLRRLRTSRTGQLEVELAWAGDATGRWHAVLPRLTVVNAAGGKRLAPARVASLEAGPPRADDGQNAGTNALINRRQPSRLALGNGFASVRTTLAGNLSTDPLTLRSPLDSLTQTTADHALKVGVSVANTVLDSARAFANSLGFTAMSAPQFERLKGWFHEAQLAHAALRAELDGDGARPALAGAFGQAFPRNRHARTLGGILGSDRAVAIELGAGARADMLESLLFDLRKVGIKDRALDPNLAPKSDLLSGANVSYQVADLWRGGTRMLGGRGDLLPALRKAFDALPADAELGGIAALDGRERALLIQVRRLLRDLEAGGARLPGAPDTAHGDGADQARRDLRDPHAMRSANIARAFVQYSQLLAAGGADQLPALAAARRHSADAGLGRLARLGVSSWGQLEALDDIVAAFRADMADPKSARRQQLLKSMGLPADARRDTMAACLTGLLLDLYNRSTFFSTASDSKSVSVSFLNHRMQVLGYGAAPGAGGEHIHALGVERIGDSLEGDAGLVAFFVRHNKASMSLLGSKAIDINPDKEGAQEDRTVAPFKDQLTKEAHGLASFSLSAAGRLSLAAAMQHGIGAAVILNTETIPEFVRLLFDAEQDDATAVIAVGVNGGGIGLDLFETNLDVRGSVAVNANFAAQPRQSFGATLPVDPGNPGVAGAPLSRRGTWSASTGATVTAEFGLHWQEMELHLDHAWKDILGLEYQGRVDFNISLDAGLYMASAFSAALGTVAGELDALIVPNLSNIRLGGVNLAMANGNFFGYLNPALNGLKAMADRVTGMDGQVALAPATYKRTLDAEAAAPVGPAQWQAMAARLLKAFPQATDLEFAALAGVRHARVEHLLTRIQGAAALQIERAASPDDRDWPASAAEATALAVARGDAWRPRSEAARAEVLDELKLLRQQDGAALRERAMLIPGARIEINTLGKGALDELVGQAVGHWHLGSKMAELDQAKKRIPGLAGVLKTIKDNSENISQVRFVFEMRPQALRALNDAMEQWYTRQEQARGDPRLGHAAGQRLAMDWSDVMHKARSAPDLYRLAVIVPHNTDDNPSAVNVGLLGFSHGRTASVSHQLFQSEVQLRYDSYDRLLGAVVLEGAARALDQDFAALRGEGLAPLAVPKPALGDAHFGPPSPVGPPII